MREPILENITGFDTTFNRHSELTHYIKHVAYDIHGVETPEDYIALARQLGISASLQEPGSQVRPRGNGDVAVYVENAKVAPYAGFAGIYMLVRSRVSYGLLATIFSPRDGKAYFDRDEANRLLL
jgi:hypothetical protein